MSKPYDFKNYPVLHKLLAMQIVSILMGMAVSVIVLVYLNKKDTEALLLQKKEEIKSSLQHEQEQLRAWKILGLERAVSQRIQEIIFKNEGLIKELTVDRFSKTNDEISNSEFIIPDIQSDDTITDYRLYVKLDSSLIYRQGKKFTALYILLVVFLIVFLAVTMSSFFFIKSRVYRPIISLKSVLDSKNSSESSYEKVLGATGEVLEFIKLFKKLNDRARTLEWQAAYSDLARQVAHDIRSPLAALDMLLGTINGLPAESGALLQSSITRIRKISEGLLEKTRQKSDQVPSLERSESFAPYNVCTLLEEIVSEKRYEYKNCPKLKIDLDIKGNVRSCSSFIDQTDFKRVISNLINNSVDATHSSGIITIAVIRDKNQLVVTVKDNGHGIPKEVQSKLWKQGFTTKMQTGNGLGLFNAKRCISEWGGSVELNSDEGIGTSITLRIPIIEQPNTTGANTGAFSSLGTAANI
jgi:signal transduction histidine kinase